MPNEIEQNKISDYDMRQYKLMMQRLESFTDKDISLHSLIADLEALLVCLQNADSSWKEEFYRCWTILEDIYSFTYIKGYKELPAEYQEKIDAAISEMKAQLNKLILSEDYL